MKALIRDPGEIITEDKGIDGIDWRNGAPLTNSQFHGGPYTLVEDYVPPTDENDEYNPDEKRKAEISELKARLTALENRN